MTTPFGQYHPLKCELSLYLYKIILSFTSEEVLTQENIFLLFTAPPKSEMGDFAFPCFQLSKTLKKSPAQIAQELRPLVEENPNNLISSVRNDGPYLNFRLKEDRLACLIIEEITSGVFFKKSFHLPLENTMVEFSQPNTHKEIHVGHMRNLALGQSLAKLLKKIGHEVHSVTYPGDVGTHVAKCLWYLKNKASVSMEELSKKANRGEILGELYTKAHQLLEEERGGEKEEKNRQELTFILQEIAKGSGEYFDLWRETRQWSIQLMENLYSWSHVNFDYWYFESEMDVPSVARIKKLYQEGKLTLSEGAIGMDLSEDKLGFCLLLKSDGNGLYSTKDVELAIHKFKQLNIEKSIYVVDVRQSLHFSQVFKVLEKLGHPQGKKCFHLAYDFVELPEGPMSSRKGNIIPINKLIDEMMNHIKENYLIRYKDEWSQEEVKQTAHDIALGAIFFGMLRIDPQKKIVFDMKEWLKLDGESGPYLQYTHARVCSMLQKIGHKETREVQNKLLIHPAEKELLLKMSELNEIIFTAATQSRPSALCNYLYDLCKVFNHFYMECPLMKAESEDLKEARAHLVFSFKEVLAHALNILGIPAVKRM